MTVRAKCFILSAGSHHTVLHDTRLLLLLSCTVKCGAETGAACLSRQYGCLQIPGDEHHSLCAGVCHSPHGDCHNCALSILPIQGEESKISASFVPSLQGLMSTLQSLFLHPVPTALKSVMAHRIARECILGGLSSMPFTSGSVFQYF